MKGMLYKTLSDMESNIVDFDVDELLLVGDDSLCNYSGLPSVKSYDDTRVPEEDTFFLGHS